MSVAPIEGISVGERFHCEDPIADRGTVRYVGPVTSVVGGQSVTKHYVGVDWDIEGRGKHDGSVGGKRYFNGQQGRGAFIHPQRLKLGVTFVQALKERYASEYDAEGAKSELYLTGTNGRKWEVNFVGAKQAQEKLSQLHLLQQISLREARVSTVGSSVAEVAPGIHSIDLEANLLGSWAEVAKLASELKLKELRLSRNNLSADSLFAAAAATESKGDSKSDSTSAVPKQFLTCFSPLKVLVLNAVPNAWQCVYALAAQGALPSLEELHLCENQLSSLAPMGSAAAGDSKTADCFALLRVLNLSTNAIASWDEVMRFAKLPRLEKLLLNENKIDRITLPAVAAAASDSKGGSLETKETKELKESNESATSAPSGCFPVLRSLSLNSNLVSSFVSVDALRALRALVKLRLQANPLESTLPQNALRPLLIAMMPQLVAVNLSDIRTRERFDAERFYLQYQYDLSLAAAKASASGSGAAPSAGAAGAGAGAASSAPAFVFPARYHELVKEHGDPALVASDGKSKDGSSTLASRLLALTLSASSAELSTLRVEKSVLPSTTVSALRKMVAAALKFPGGSDFVLAYRDGPSEPLVELDDLSKPLSHYHARSGGEIIAKE